MNPESFFKALLDLWDELPGLVGQEAWAKLLPRLKALIFRFHATADPNEQVSLLADVAVMFRNYPQARERLRAIVWETDRNQRTTSRGYEAEPVTSGPGLSELLIQLQQRLAHQRYVNVCVARHSNQKCLPKRISLRANEEYDLRVNIGPFSPDSVVENPGEFPEKLLPETEIGHWLEVVTVSDDFAIPKRRHYLFLPEIGPSWVCECPPGGDHNCSNDGRERYLFIPIRAPQKPSEARLRIAVYYQNNLVQSQLLTAQIVEAEQEAIGHKSWIDYTITAALGDVGFLPARTLNILTNYNDDGTHKIVVKDGAHDILAFNLSEGQMRDTLNAARRALRDIHIEEVRGWLGGVTLRNRYDANNSKTTRDFNADLRSLAPIGRKLWAALLGEQLPERWEKLERPGTIQVSRTGSSKFVFPWALVYDLPLEPGDGTEYEDCRLLKEWDGASTLIDESTRSCPYEGEHKLNTICPFGFWGFKHIIEQPPSMPEGWSLPLIVRASNRPLKFVVGLSLNLNTNLTKAHLARLAPVVDCDSLDELRKTLATAVEIVYFYTHGRRKPLAGASQQIPVLELGTGEPLEPDHILAWRQAEIWPKNHWQDTSPLVFINGCHTAELTPELLVNFVDTFGMAYAAGVIGTEITLEQKVASEAAEQFFSHFRTNKTVGQALQSMRRYLLLKGNLLGLAYTAYCSTDLKLLGGGG
jgi:hypothetical protein